LPSLQIHELLSFDTLRKSIQPADFESLYEILPYELYWDKVIKKEARGLDDYDLGEVEEVNNDTVITKKGLSIKIGFTCQGTKFQDSMVINCGSKSLRIWPRDTDAISTYRYCQFM
jgi:hypothetical protein